MNTPAHLIFAAAAFARPNAPRRNAAAIAGGLAPDLSLYLMTAWAIWVQGIPARVVFNDLYFSPAWQQVFAIDNSVFVWGAVLAIGAALRSSTVMVFAGAALLHLALDFPVHHDDGRPHFWPVTMWVFESPVSYWDHRHFGRWIGAAEVVACIVLLLVLWRRFSGLPARTGIAVSLAAIAAPAVLFGFLLH